MARSVRGCPRLVVRSQHSHPIAAGTFANVGIKGPLAKILIPSGALDLTFACGCAIDRLANVKSAPLAGNPQSRRGKRAATAVAAIHARSLAKPVVGPIDRSKYARFKP